MSPGGLVLRSFPLACREVCPLCFELVMHEDGNRRLFRVLGPHCAFEGRDNTVLHHSPVDRNILNHVHSQSRPHRMQISRQVSFEHEDSFSRIVRILNRNSRR